MRYILFILLATGCSRPATPVAPPAPTTTAAATCRPDVPAPFEIKVEIKKPRAAFAREACR
jgi:hypothetical protein